MHRQPLRWAGLLVGRVVKGFTARRMADEDLLEARLLWRFFLSAAILLVACFAYATQSKILALPSSLQGPVAGSLPTTSGSEPAARGGRGRRQRGGGAAAGPQSARKEARPMATAAHEIDWRSHLLGLSEHFALAHFPSAGFTLSLIHI